MPQDNTPKKRDGFLSGFKMIGKATGRSISDIVRFVENGLTWPLAPLTAPTPVKPKK